MRADARNPEARTRLGYMPEHDCLPPNQSAAHFITHMAEVSGIPPARSRALAADMLRHVGLFEERYRPIGGYSTGMKQRVKLAQALVHDPILVLLDEPTAGLDPTGRTEMLNLIRRIAREFGISLVLSTHLMQDVERTCDNIVLLDAGRVKESADVASLTEETELVYVEVANNRAQFMVELTNRNVNHTLEGNAISIPDVDGAKCDAVRDALVTSEARLVRMGPRQRALIDLFRTN
jgi:ABC-2 type transport system ATP-binding protein